jgi:hypothetical protein
MRKPDEGVVAGVTNWSQVVKILKILYVLSTGLYTGQ